jgi:hypothetical protein
VCRKEVVEVSVVEEVMQEVREGRKKAKTYVLNTLTVPLDWDSEILYYVTLKKVNINGSKELLRNGFISAVGHEATAKLLTELLGIEIPYNRIQVKMTHFDRALHFVLKERIPEGKILTLDELKQIGYYLVVSEVV